MFLALREILYSKTKYILIIIVIMLTSYLTLFLTGLAFGLAHDNRSSVDAWHADGIILSKDANNSIAMSFLDEKQVDSIKAKDVAKLRATPTIITASNNTSEKVTTYLFGIEKNQFIAPDVSEGKMFHNQNESVVDYSLHTQYGFNIGDTIEVPSLNKKLKITGFSENKKFNTAPVIYVALNDFQSMVQMPSTHLSNNAVNAVVYKGDVTYDKSTLKQLTIPQFINEIPGYRPQVLTFGLMIGFLIGIVAFVLGIFIYVLTVQKTAMFGVMKAQGISNKVILRSVLAQTLFLTFVGLAIGLFLTFITVLFLPSKVPFELNIALVSFIVALTFAFSALGSVFSLRSATKVDPLIAMGV